MKKLLLILVFVLTSTGYAQVDKGEVILMTDPVTNCEYRYYYFPNLEAYFDQKKNQYHFKDNAGNWTVAAEIPSGYRGYGMYNKVNVLIDDFDGDDPTQLHAIYKKRYPYITAKRGRMPGMTANVD